MGAPVVKPSLSISALSMSRGRKPMKSPYPHTPASGYPSSSYNSFYCPSIQGNDFEPRKEKAPWSHFAPHTHLSLQFWVDLEVKGVNHKIRILFDTGAEVNVIQKGLLPEEFSLWHGLFFPFFFCPFAFCFLLPTDVRP